MALHTPLRITLKLCAHVVADLGQLPKICPVCGQAVLSVETVKKPTKSPQNAKKPANRPGKRPL